ncbi:MAG: hypothetical protein MRJ68_19195 [Nitrospira sp.]|nr:hypothetical protein [Nitrospira sp.]
MFTIATPGIDEMWGCQYMLAAYFDASTSQKDKHFVTVAGCVAPINRWKTFESKWQKLLDKERLLFFHMTDFESYQGPYRGWSRKQHKHFMRKITKAIVTRTSFAFGRGVAHEDFEWAQSQKQELRTFRSPFTYCAAQCFGAVTNWADGHNEREPIIYIFEAGDGFDGELRRYQQDIERSESLKARYRWNGLYILPKAMEHPPFPLTPLQAADVWAFEARKEWENFHSTGERQRPVRRSARSLLGKGVEIDFGYSTRESLLNLVPYSEGST